MVAPEQFSSLGVVILGAGASSRMGRPKLLLPWQGTTVVGHLISQWRDLGAGQVTIVHRPDDQLLFAELARLNFPAHDRIENPHPESGMFSSIVCAANWEGWQAGLVHRAIVLGDQPHFRPETLRTLLAFAAQYPAKVCQPTWDGYVGHPVLLPSQVFIGLRQSSAPTLKDFLKPFSGETVYCSVSDPGLVLDMDTPEDYKRVLSRS